ncbi:hypothetical protein MTAT_05490 [Moorella thermoacetica]|uniref:Uncharacterized protein n=1 Tax=Neomoorella thermoacetica TaxID=1525 RepID=A0AAC9HHF7_NEOTH|nr:hypothetical protein [Moorella thermoacetica]AOQ23914.1 hypothetical protein Maut_01471 [Moorella thermoacetica]TYL14318.1 hypothetical protein MTAT_05490 [Moorella thermoacetica]
MRSQRLENEVLQRVDELVQCAISISLKDESAREEQLNRGITLVKEMGDLLLEVLEGREEHLQALLEQLIAQRLPDRRVLQSFGNFPRDIQQMISNGIASYLASRQEKKGQGNTAAEASNDGVVPVESTPAGTDLTARDEPVCEEIESGQEEPGGKADPEAIPVAVQERVGQEATGVSTPGAAATLPETTPVPPQPPEPAGKEGNEDPTSGIATAPGSEEDIQETRVVTAAATEALYLALLQAYPGEEIVRDYETRGGKITFYLPGRQLGFELDTWHHDWRHDFYCRQEGISIRRVAGDELANPAYLARRLRREAIWRQSS